MRLALSITLLLLIVADIFSQSSNDILNLLVSNKTISQVQADSVRAEAALLQQQADASRKSFFVTVARQMQLTGYSQIRYQLLEEAGRAGWYVQSGYFIIPQKLQVLGKYDVFDSNTSSADNISTNYVFGANYNFNTWSRLQAFYTIRHEEGMPVVNNYASIQYQIGF